MFISSSYSLLSPGTEILLNLTESTFVLMHSELQKSQDVTMKYKLFWCKTPHTELQAENDFLPFCNTALDASYRNNRVTEALSKPL